MIVWKVLAVVGLAMALLGLLLLFRYGMPFRVETRGETSIVTGGVDSNEIALEKRYRTFSYFGLGFAVIGTLLQIAAVIAS